MTNNNLNSRLNSARANKNDDFYTQLTDIEKELKHYKKHFKNKIIFCNCDDPRTSNFFHFFSYNFERLGLKKLITTCYRNNQVDMFSEDNNEQAIMLEYTGNKNGNNVPDIEEIGIHKLQGDGDFRSEECTEILKNADIVITNPPFSLFKEYVQHLIDHDKKFLVLGSMNAIKYKNIFSLIKSDKIWLGVDNGGTKWFEVKDEYEIKTKTRQKTENGKKYFSMGNIAWYTNLDHKKRNEELILYKKYSPSEYPNYDNYDAIHIPTVLEIPADYEGYMGVPVTFIDKYNKNQFEIFGIMNSGEKNKGIRYENTPHGRPLIDGKEIYTRILVKRKI